MGRHSPSARPKRSPVVPLSLLLVVVLVGWLSVEFLTARLGGPDCDAVTPLAVAAAPEIAGVVEQVARDAGTSDCSDVTVTAVESGTVAGSLAVSDGTPPPDVWLPESTMWLRRAQSAGAWQTPVAGTSIASSPVVLALTEAAATGLGWPERPPAWAQVVGPGAAAGIGDAVGLPDPAKDAVGVGALFAVTALTRSAPDPTAAMTATLRKLSLNTAPQPSDLFARLPGGVGTQPPLAGFPASETALLRHNAKPTETKLVAAYADPAPPSLDYPYVALPQTRGAALTAAGKFLARLLGPGAREPLGAAGFRAPDGTALRDRPEDERTSGAPHPVVPLPPAEEVDRVLTEWAGVNLSARIQVLLDVSGSMAEAVPGSGKTRIDLTLDAAEAGIGLFKPSTKIGVWVFSTSLDGDKDYRELLPVRTVGEQLATGGLQTLRGVRDQTRGATGLYDSVLAAYRSARQNWEPGRINLVLVLTDGRNEDRDGISRDQLLTELAALQDPRRPIQVVGIGIGPDVDTTELQAISAATGGQSFTTPDPTQITNIFYAALGKLLCQPPTCK